MDSKQDPRIQIYANLDDVQKDIEQAAKDRKDQIKSQAKDDKKAIKDERKDLQQGVKDDYKEYKDKIKDRDDPYSKEKSNIAKEAHNIMKKDIEADYNETIDRIDMDADERINSIDNMLADDKDDIKDQDIMI